MDSVTLTARCYKEGLLSKEAAQEVLAVRERLIKEAIARKVASRFGAAGKAIGEGEGFLARLKGSLGMGGAVKKTKSGDSSALEWPHVVGNLVKLLGAGAALQAGSAGVHGLLVHRKDQQLKGQIEDSYGKMMKEYPKLQEMDKGKVTRHFGVLARYAPSLAADPMVAGSWVQSTAQMGYIDTDAIKRLSDTQTAIDRAHEERSLLQPGQFGKGMQIAQTAMGG